MAHNRHYQAGIFLGLLFFKPQFAIPLSGLFLLSGRWRVWASAGVTALVLFGVSTVLAGPSWILEWFDILSRMLAHLTKADRFANIISWSAIATALFGGEGGNLSDWFRWGVMAATTGLVSWVWFAGGRTADIGAQVGIAAVFVLMLSPQTSFYDAGIAMITLVSLLYRHNRLGLVVIGAVWAASHLQPYSPTAGISLTVPPLLLILTLAFVYLWRPATQDAVFANAPIPNTGTGAQRKPI